MIRFPGKLALQQRVLPNYRAPFFDLLASACDGGMSLFTGLPRPSEGIATDQANYKLPITHWGKIFISFSGSFYLCYQLGLIDWLKNWDPGCIDRGSQSALSFHACCCEVDASAWQTGHRLGIGCRHRVRASMFAQGVRERVVGCLLSQFDALIAYSQRGADEYAASGFPREKIFVAHNSVSPPPSCHTSVPTIDLRRQTVYPVRWSSAGPQTVDHLLRACAQMESQPRLVIVGDGPEREAL